MTIPRLDRAIAAPVLAEAGLAEAVLAQAVLPGAGCQPVRCPAGTAAAREAQLLRAAGLLRLLVADVYVEADVVEDPAVRARAVAAVLPTRLRAAGTVVGLGSAAWVHSGWLPVPGVPLPLVEVVLAPGRSVGEADLVRIRQCRLDPGDMDAVHGLPVTSPARTAVDLARVLPARQLVPALAALTARTGLRPEQVLARLGGITGARGIRRARALLEVWAAGASDLPAAGGAVGVEHAFHPADGCDHVPEVGRVGHLEGELRDRHPIA